MQPRAHHFLDEPNRDYVLGALLLFALTLDFFVPRSAPVLFVFAGIAVVPTIARAIVAARHASITIDTFNAFAIVVAFLTGDAKTAAFIALMLTFARMLEWRNASRTEHAVNALLRLKPQTATRVVGELQVDIPVDDVKSGDVLLAALGARIAADGVVTYGSAHVNEAMVTGESAFVKKESGDRVLAGTLVESGVVRLRVERIGKDATIDRMVALMRDAAAHKSHAQKLADKFAVIFLPVVAVIGFLTYAFSGSLTMVAAIFLVACADDMAVAIPLAMTASLGHAARRGVIIKGGEWLDVLARLRILVLDKTGTLTYGTLGVERTTIAEGVTEKDFWMLLGSAEKFSEHPVGRTVFRAAQTHVEHIPDPDAFTAHTGLGVEAMVGGKRVVVGTEALLHKLALKYDSQKKYTEHVASTGFFVFVDGSFSGFVTIADVPRKEAKESIVAIRRNVPRIIMFTGDTKERAKDIASTLDIRECQSAMSPEDKVRELEALLLMGPVGMVGDGVNDAPVLSRADVGIAMGGGGSAIAVEAADVVILTDNLSRIPEMIELGRRTSSVIRLDMILWAFLNVLGFALVFTGLLGPALAALFNFATDFLPLINSSRLFRRVT